MPPADKTLHRPYPVDGCGFAGDEATRRHPSQPSTITTNQSGIDRNVARLIPAIQTGDGSFGVWTNQFGFNISWTSGQTVVVEASTNLANPYWQPLQTNTLTSGSAWFNDPERTNFPGRFYRLRSP